MSLEDADNRQNFNGMLVAEAERVLADPVFRRSPVLSRLLKFLVDATLTGTADSLNSFAVAVDGLGRPETFDSASDSSARVQMVRLRKTLEIRYAQHGPSDECCIYLQPGSYRVRMAELAEAYPNLYGSRPENQHIAAAATGSGSDQVAKPDNFKSTPPPKDSRSISRESMHGGRFFAIAFAAAALLSISAYAIWQQFTPPQRTPRSPILELMPIVSSGDNMPGLDQTARMISSTFTDDLPRFKMSRVRIIMAGDDARELRNGEHVYRLYSRLESDPQGAANLFLRLNDVRTNTVFWSRQIKLPVDTHSASQAIAPLVSEVNGPFGAIATHETAIYRDWDAGGYVCALKYFNFVATREEADEDRVIKCLDKPVEQEEVVATMLAIRALFTLERSSAASDKKAAADQAMDFASSAVAADPNDGSANFAAARISYIRRDCVSARFYTQRTLETNSRSPMFTSTLAALANICAYPGAEKLLDQALMVQNSKYAKGRMLLVMAALAQDRPDKIKDVIASDLPAKRYNRVNYYLTETLIAAVQGQRANAARNWERFAQLMLPESNNPDEKLRSIVMHPGMRRKVIELLEKGGAFSA